MKMKKAQSTGFAWVYGLIFLAAVGMLFIIFNQVIIQHLQPTSQGILNLSRDSGYLNQTQINALNTENEKYYKFFNIFPFVFVFIIIMWLVVASIRSKKQDEIY